jgi:hypothetical protein
VNNVMLFMLVSFQSNKSHLQIKYLLVRFWVQTATSMKMAVCRILRSVAWNILTDVSVVLTAFIIRSLMMEAVSSSETSVNIYRTTRRNVAENSHLRNITC